MFQTALIVTVALSVGILVVLDRLEKSLAAIARQMNSLEGRLAQVENAVDEIPDTAESVEEVRKVVHEVFTLVDGISDKLAPK